MRLEAEEAVDDVRPRLLEHARPDDVRLLVEAGLELDDRGHLLAALGRADERLDDGRVAARAVERLLDREHVGVVGGARDELDDAVERLVRVLEQHVLLAEDGEDVVDLAQRRHGVRHERLVAQVARSSRVARCCIRSADVEHAAGRVDVLVGVELERLDELGQRSRRRVARDLEAHGVAALAAPQLLLDRLEQIVGLLLVDLDVEVARDAEDVEALDAHAGEDGPDVARDEVLEQDEGAGRRVPAPRPDRPRP